MLVRYLERLVWCVTVDDTAERALRIIQDGDGRFIYNSRRIIFFSDPHFAGQLLISRRIAVLYIIEIATFSFIDIKIDYETGDRTPLSNQASLQQWHDHKRPNEST